jgi:hypothetical protein
MTARQAARMERGYVLFPGNIRPDYAGGFAWATLAWEIGCAEPAPCLPKGRRRVVRV